MSFKDVGRNTSIHALPKSIQIEVNNSDSRILEQISPKLVFDQISEALDHHQQERHVLKEKLLINHATTVPRYNSEKNLSAFSKLSDEIVKFQKLTNDLQAIVNQDMMTPEDQWK
jgi:ethanolamine utilization protein EutQ (cupin superfamily)